ncbi:hypothetical protein BDV98DRAFT_604672 [Pterulicium gracile]|uniref:Lysine-specific metallo-endopeptidase domain-containing protein n=1 Tax=Pterulicium gracile TaxID=1884261 RepID=A0A5C3QH07_9AGAR|nr:hypothetical protein BDV98DRAFT_604672 [Pterula gracilis]
MFRSAIPLSLTTLALGLSSGDIKVTLNAVSSSVSSIEDIILTTVISSPTSSDIRVIKSANVLDDSPSDSFAIHTGFSNEANFATILAGQPIAVNHTVTALYDFGSHGTGTFAFKPWTYFQTDIDQPVIERHVIDVDEASGNRALNPNCNDGGKLQNIRDSISFARSLTGGAASDIRNRPNSNEWNKFFGNVNNRDEIWYRFDLIAGDVGNCQVYCNRDDASVCNRAAACVWNGNVYMCDNFLTFQEPIEQINNSKGGVVLHELSHVSADTTDHAYGCQTVQGLSTQQKRNNADDYQCMALNVYRILNC